MIAIFSLQIVWNARLVWQQSLVLVLERKLIIYKKKNTEILQLYLGLQYFSQVFIFDCGCVSSCVCFVCLSSWFIPHCNLVLSVQDGQATGMVSAWPTCSPIAVWQYKKKKTSCLNIAFIYVDCVLAKLRDQFQYFHNIFNFPKKYDFSM